MCISADSYQILRLFTVRLDCLCFLLRGKVSEMSSSRPWQRVRLWYPQIAVPARQRFWKTVVTVGLCQ